MYAGSWQELSVKLSELRKQETKAFFENDLDLMKELDKYNKQFFMEHASELCNEAKSFIQDLVKFVIDKKSTVIPLYTEFISILETDIKTFDQLLYHIETLEKSTYNHTLEFLDAECDKLMLLKPLIRKIVTAFKNHKSKWLASLHSIEPMAIDDDMLQEAKAELKKTKAALEFGAIEAIYTLTNRPQGTFDLLFESLTLLLQDPRFHEARENMKQGKRFDWDASPYIAQTVLRYFSFAAEIDDTLARESFI